MLRYLICLVVFVIIMSIVFSSWWLLSILVSGILLVVGYSIFYSTTDIDISLSEQDYDNDVEELFENG